MEEFLKDSPSDFGSNTGNTGGGNAGANYGNDQNNRNNYDLGYYGNNYGQPGYPGIPENDFAGPDNNYINETGNNFTSSLQNDPFLEDLESLNFTNKQPQYINPSESTTGNLEEIISPSSQVQSISLNNNGMNPENSFVNPQYFSPPNRNANYNTLNSIAEDSLSNSFNNAFSPSVSRNDSVSIPYQNPNPIDDYNGGVDINAGSYLSPQFNSQYMSPNNNIDNSIDTLRSPSLNSGSYLNSPPTKYQNVRRENPSAISNSIPSNISKNKVVSPPPMDNGLGTSLPGSMHNQPSVSTKQLSKEEKLKRRREFHNAVERRRRDLIKERIKDLGFLVPPSLLNPQLCAVQNLQRNSQLNSREINDLLASIKVKETKPNKSTILNKSVDYIIHLKYVLEQQSKSQRELTLQIEELEAKINNNINQGTVGPSTTSNQSQPSSDIKLENQDDLFNPDDFFLEIPGNTSNQNQFFNDNIR